MADDKLQDSLLVEKEKYNYNLKVEQKKYEYNIDLEEKKFIYVMSLESFKAILESGRNAMKAPFILNSGASIAMLTFITKLITDKEVELAKALLFSLKWYVIGVFCAAIAYGITYFTQIYNYKYVLKQKDKYYKYGTLSNILSIIFVFASLSLFAYSSYSFYLFIQSYKV